MEKTGVAIGASSVNSVGSASPEPSARDPDADELSFNICNNIKDRLRVILHPIEFVRSDFDEETQDSVTHLLIRPEAFRMWFYLGFYIFSIIAITVSTGWADLDMEDNPIINRFGANNICIYYDYPPFAYFGATLWAPQVINLLLYQVFDLFRVYDEYHESTQSKRQHNQISKTFYTFYCVCTGYESFATIFFLQITATSPFESMYMHSIPFVCFIIALWLMACKHFVFFVQSGFLRKYYHSCYYYLGIVYIILLGITGIIKMCITIPNLFQARLWEQEGLEWTQPLSAVNDRIYTVAVTLSPMLVYLIFAPRLRAVTLTLNRSHEDHLYA